MFLLMIYLPHILQVLYCENISINGQILEQGLAAAPALACAWRGLARLCEDEISGLFVGCRLPGEAILARHRSLCWPEGRFGYGDCNKSSLVVGSTKAQYGSKSLVCTHFSQRTTSAHSLAHCCAIFLGHWVLIFAKNRPDYARIFTKMSRMQWLQKGPDFGTWSRSGPMSKFSPKQKASQVLKFTNPIQTLCKNSRGDHPKIVVREDLQEQSLPKSRKRLFLNKRDYVGKIPK